MKLFGKKYDIAVIGYGSWATALVGLLTGKGKSVIWHIRNLDILETVRSEGINPKYLSELELNTKFIEVSADINACLLYSSVCSPRRLPEVFPGAAEDIPFRQVHHFRYQGPHTGREHERIGVPYLNLQA